MTRFLIAAALSLMSISPGQAEDFDEVNPAALRRFWLGASSDLAPAAARYKLDEAQLKQFGGAFGVDLSHYSFDISGGACGGPQGYNSPNCSCTADWSVFEKSEVQFIYTKASDAVSADPSFNRVWGELESRHTAKTLYRGAYHFLRPGVDAAAQASAFLKTIGATNGAKPHQLPPVLDIEWSNRRIALNSPEYNACPASRRVKNDKGQWYCDMWYKVSPSDIAAMAKKWIEIVERETSRPVIIYTNPTGWWNPVMGRHGDDLMKRQAVWTSRYTDTGPRFNSKWEKEAGAKENGSIKWKMAPLPRGARYSDGDKYQTAHFWQFTDNGSLPSNSFICKGAPESRGMDMNWLPISKNEYPRLFGVGP